MLNQSDQRLVIGREALARGDAKQALKDLSVSISLNPSTEAYFLRAEANFSSGNIDGALDDLHRATKLCRGLPEKDHWLDQIEQALNRYEGASDLSSEPHVDQTISVLLPTSLGDSAKVLKRLAGRPDLSYDGQTMFRKGGTVIYELQFFDRNVDWAKCMLQQRVPAPLRPGLADYISEHTDFLHLQAPNWDIAQSTKSQIVLAIEYFQTLELLMRALSLPVALLRTANQVHTFEEVQFLSDDLSTNNLVNAYAKFYNAGDEMFSAGMHVLGCADAQIPFAVIKAESAVDVLQEFQLFQVINRSWEFREPIEFESAVTGLSYKVELRHCDRFDVRGEARFNPKGIWTFTQAIG
jgi:tetratricopeptide (TPR) repeat protein